MWSFKDQRSIFSGTIFMLTAVEGIYEEGTVRLLEPLPNKHRARVMVVIMPEPLLLDGSPLDVQLTEEERAIWEALPRFRTETPQHYRTLQPDQDMFTESDTPAPTTEPDPDQSGEQIP
jgi:hypothetical protein